MSVRQSTLPVKDSITSPVLVLGATSLVGQFLVQRLANAGIDVVATSRKPQPAMPHVDWISADLTVPGIEIAGSAQLAISTVPTWLLPPVLPLMHESGIRRLVAFSSTSRFTKLTSPLERERWQAARLTAAEDAIQSFCERSDIPWTILRPTLVYAEGRDRNVSRLAAFAQRFRVLPLAGSGMGRRQPVHADDLAVGAIQSASSQRARNRAYNLPGGETLTYLVMCERIFEGLGLQARVILVPTAIWSLGALTVGRAIPGFSSAVGVRMSEDLTFDGAPAERDFGWHARPFHPRFQTRAEPAEW